MGTALSDPLRKGDDEGMRIFTVMCRRDDQPGYCRFLLETESDYRVNSKKLHKLAIAVHELKMRAGELPPSHVIWVDSGAHEALAPQI